jgi:hypothetical protein
MFKKIKKLLIITTAFSTLMAFVAAPAAVYAGAIVNNNITGNLCTGANAATGGGSFNLNGASSNDQSCANDTSAGKSLGSILTEVINIMSLLVGAICVIMIIVGGFKYVTSGGESNNVTGAKNTIVYAIVGLVIVALAQIIVHFVLSRLNNAQA